MTKENILKKFVEDSLVLEKGYLTETQIDLIRFSEPTNNKLIGVIKLAIAGVNNGDSESLVSRKITNYLNK